MAAHDEHHLIDTSALVQDLATVGDSSGGAMKTAVGVGVEDLPILDRGRIRLDLIRRQEQVTPTFEHAQHRHRRRHRLPFGLSRVVANHPRARDEGVGLGEHVGRPEALTLQTHGGVDVSVAELQRERIRSAELPGQLRGLRRGPQHPYLRSRILRSGGSGEFKAFRTVFLATWCLRASSRIDVPSTSGGTSLKASALHRVPVCHSA
ncbi:hypothetical protein G9E11_20665 [Arthrobacter sp. IA7]|uniref:hypothetical protein n=1 Tax=Arthrobacter ipis TaxID=2716202 RepID=UPI0016898A20|nr:hypothetical protein [Arthrobacter ipis]MBD1544604.1 hypothetical protein [Arthrobacter ipis]